MPGLAMGQGSAGTLSDLPGPPGPPGPLEGHWGPRGTYPPYEDEDEAFDEQPSPERGRAATRVRATATPSSPQDSSSDRVRINLADILTQIRILLHRIAQIDSNISYASSGSRAATERQREQLRNRRIAFMRDSRILRESAGFRIIELVQQQSMDIHEPASTPSMQSGDAARDDSNGLLRTSRDFLRQEFFNHIDEDLRSFFEEQFRDLESLLNRSGRSGSNNSNSSLSLYNIALASSTLSRSSNTTSNRLHDSNSNRRGTNLSNHTRESRTNNSVRELAEYRFSRRRTISSDTHSITSYGLSPRSQSPAVLSGVRRRRGYGGSSSQFPSTRRRARRTDLTPSHRIRSSPLSNENTIHPTPIISQPRSPPFSMLQDSPRERNRERENFASRRSWQPLPNSFESAHQHGVTSSIESQGVSASQNQINSISLSTNPQYQRDFDVNGEALSVQQLLQANSMPQVQESALVNAQLVSLDGFHDDHQEDASISDQSQDSSEAQSYMSGFPLGSYVHQRLSDTNDSRLSSHELMQRQMMLSRAPTPSSSERAEAERLRQERLFSTSDFRTARDGRHSSGPSQGETAFQDVMNDVSTLTLSESAIASSRTNWHPPQPRIDGFDDIDIPQTSSNGVPRSMTLYFPQLQAPNGRWSSEPSRIAGPSSWTNGRPLDTFNDLFLREADAGSEDEDLAQQSRGSTIGNHHNSEFPIRCGRQLFSSETNHSPLLLRRGLLTNDIVCRGDGEVTRMGAGESYRPTARPRSPPRTDSFRGDRDRDRSPRRERARTPPTDSWHPNSRDRSPRRRSRTPPRRDRSPLRDNWRARPRSPIRARTPQRRYSPRRDDDRRARSPVRRDDRRRSRSPYDRERPTTRARSPLPRRSPPAGPRASYRTRSRSAERRDDRVPTGPSSANWRRRSPSPPARDSERSSERTSGSTSRRSSPPIHSERLHLTQTATRDSRPRSLSTRDRSPPSQLAYRDRDSARSTPRERSPMRPVAPRSPPRGPAGFRAPTGPSGGRNFTAPSPSASSSNTAVSMSAHNRSENTGPIVPPSGPRGYVPPARGAYGIRGGRGSFGSDRVSRPDTSLWGAAPPSRPATEISTRVNAPASRPIQTPSTSIPSGPAASIPTGPSGGIPTGPRAGIPSRPSLQHSSSSYNSRPNPALSSNSGSRPHPAMANLPQIIPGGRIDPTASGIPGDIAARLKRKEEEAEALREELHAKQEKLRQGLKGWDKLSRDSQSMGLRSELSERHVRMLAGEGVGGAAF